MENIEYITCESGDWEVLKVDGEIFEEGHRIYSDTFLELLEKFGVKITEIEISDEDMEYRRY